MGAYGGTGQASRSPDILADLSDPNNLDDPTGPYRNLRADLSGDWLVNADDIAIVDSFMGTQTNLSPLAADLDQDGEVEALVVSVSEKTF